MQHFPLGLTHGMNFCPVLDRFVSSQTVVFAVLFKCIPQRDAVYRSEGIYWLDQIKRCRLYRQMLTHEPILNSAELKSKTNINEIKKEIVTQ